MFENHQLNSKYFEYLDQRQLDQVRYEAYRPKGRPMILFSLVDGSPLAALTFRAQDVPGNGGDCLISQRPSRDGDFNCDFQGLINRDDQEFELIITNLSDRSYINFNILKKDESVETVNPGGLNEINELRPNESYAVRCDQVDNRSLILSTMTNSDGTKITVQSDENEAQKRNENPKGTYFYLSVVPQVTDLTLVRQFEKTRWACVDVFCRQIEVPQSRLRPRLKGGPRVASRRMTPMGRSINSWYNDRRSLDLDLGGGPENCQVGTYGSDDIGFFKNECVGDNVIMQSHESDEIGFFESERIDDNVMMKSHAANVRGGRRIEVNSAQTNIEYAYDKMSDPCVLGLSVASGLRFYPEPNRSELVDLAVQLIIYRIRNKTSRLLEMLEKKYVEEICCICLEENPNVIFYQCGHQCTHLDCVKSLQKRCCPLCRSYISAEISV